MSVAIESERVQLREMRAEDHDFFVASMLADAETTFSTLARVAAS